VGLEKAELHTEANETIVCLFNPAEITVAKSNNWNAGEAKGVNAPKLRFQGGQSATMNLTLILDTTDRGSDVTEHTNKLLDLMKVRKELPAADAQRNSARPPWVQFRWGSLHSFKAVVDKLSLRFTYFSSGGMPLRAKADLSLRQWTDEEAQPLQNPTSHASSMHSVHTLMIGETLDRIAARYYGDPTRWRLIADVNGLVDPLALPIGSPIFIPDLPVRGRG
jgi:nucleoid-associated protein YgaU